MPDLRRMNSHEYVRDGLAYVCSIISTALGFCLLIVTIVGLVLAILVAVDLRHVPDIAFLKHYHPVGSIEIYDNKDRFVCAVDQEANRNTTIVLKLMPLPLQQAVLAAEDRQFYEHMGISPRGMVRAAMANMQAHHVVEGGSTITQQLAKNLFFSGSDRSFDRKLAEIWVAADIERRYSKPEILTMYLNEIYFGNNAYGVEQAALTYFGKHVNKLDLAESAFLAGLIRSPSTYGDPQHRTEAIAQQRQVLDAMVACGFVTHFQGQRAKFESLDFHSAVATKPRHLFTVYPYYVSYVLDLVKARYNDAIVKRQGLKVYTNLDQNAQKAAEQILAQEIKRAPAGITQEALISISVKDGSVRAIVGGAGDYWTKQWNCATNPHTVGSVFKPFVYLTAFLNNVLSPNTEIDDAPLTVHQIDSAAYSPKNYDGRFLGTITVREALSKSRNVCAVRVAQMVGMNNVIETAKSAGVKGELAANISSALGSSALSPLDVAGAYGTFARCGVSITPRALRRVEAMDGGVVETFDSDAHRVFPEEPVAWLDSILEDVVKSGTGTQAKLADRPVAGKTGTADKAKDLWFVGFTPDMVTAAWGGNDKNLPIADQHVTGGTVMARLWREYNKLYYSKSPTAAGTFLASKYDPSAIPDIKKPVSKPDAYDSASVSGETKDSSHSRAALKRIYNPSGGVAVRKTRGVTDYTWNH